MTLETMDNRLKKSLFENLKGRESLARAIWSAWQKQVETWKSEDDFEEEVAEFTMDFVFGPWVNQWVTQKAHEELESKKQWISSGNDDCVTPPPKRLNY